jgi:GT2 family glycosyltransferase
LSVTVIVVGFGDEPVLEECLSSIHEQLGPGDEVVLVDNGITNPPISASTRTVKPSLNRGFGAGCAAGVLASRGDALVFVNSDAVLLPGAVAALTLRLDDPTVGMVAGCVALADRPDTVNSAGLPVHLSGLSWCDGYGDQVQHHQLPREVTSVAGAFFACSRAVWEALGGMDESYFMYHEDTDLSLRCHLAGRRIVYSPDAVALHSYDFSRNANKMYLLERNRFLTVLADFPTHLLLRVLPVIVLLEPLYLVVALRDGWGREKARAWGWLLRHTGVVRARRRRVQAQVRDRHALDNLLAPAVTQTQLDPPRALTLLNWALTRYWRAVRPTRSGAS